MHDLCITQQPLWGLGQPLKLNSKTGTYSHKTGSDQGTQTRLCDNLEGLGGLGAGREALEGGDICISMAYP